MKLDFTSINRNYRPGAPKTCIVLANIPYSSEDHSTSALIAGHVVAPKTPAGPLISVAALSFLDLPFLLVFGLLGSLDLCPPEHRS